MTNDLLMWGPDSTASFTALDPDHILRGQLRLHTTDELTRMGKQRQSTVDELTLLADELKRRERTARLLPSELRLLYGSDNPFRLQAPLERLEYLTVVIERREDPDPDLPDFYAEWPVPPHEMISYDLRGAQAFRFTRAELALAGLRNQLETDAILRQSEQRSRDNLFGTGYSDEEEHEF